MCFRGGGGGGDEQFLSHPIGLPGHFLRQQILTFKNGSQFKVWGCRQQCKQCTVKNIRRFYGKIAGNQLPVHFPLFFTGARKHFQESGTER